MNYQRDKNKKKYSVEYMELTRTMSNGKHQIWTISNICIYRIPEGDRHQTFQK